MQTKSKLKIVSIAGSDSAGCAGIQADLRVLNNLDCHGATIITAITAQNTVGITDILPIPIDSIEAQFEAVMTDIGADAIKIGLLFSEDIIQTVAKCCQQYPNIPIVLDPVCVATTGAQLLDTNAVNALLNQLIPLVTVLTPNRFEADYLLSQIPQNVNTTNIAAVFNCQACLVTGGDTNGNTCTDELFILDTQGAFHYQHNKITTNNNHGSGCSLSTAIAVFLAKGNEIPSAIEKAIQYIQTGLTGGRPYQIGKGSGPLAFQANSPQ